jgi:hypothetical protein
MMSETRKRIFDQMTKGAPAAPDVEKVLPLPTAADRKAVEDLTDDISKLISRRTKRLGLSEVHAFHALLQAIGLGACIFQGEGKYQAELNNALLQRLFGILLDASEVAAFKVKNPGCSPEDYVEYLKREYGPSLSAH